MLETIVIAAALAQLDHAAYTFEDQGDKIIVSLHHEDGPACCGELYVHPSSAPSWEFHLYEPFYWWEEAGLQWRILDAHPDMPYHLYGQASWSYPLGLMEDKWDGPVGFFERIGPAELILSDFDADDRYPAAWVWDGTIPNVVVPTGLRWQEVAYAELGTSLEMRSSVMLPSAVGAAGHDCPGPTPLDCNASIGQVWASFILVDTDHWPYWAYDVWGGIDFAADFGPEWIHCDVQDAFVQYAVPDGSVSDEMWRRPFVTFGGAEGLYCMFDTEMPVYLYGPIRMEPRLWNVAYNDDANPSVPFPNAIWWFQVISNWDGFHPGGGVCYDCMPDLSLTGAGSSIPGTPCEVTQDAYAVSLTLGLWASESYFCPTDLDLNGTTNMADVLFLLANWGNPFDVRDFLSLLRHWGGCPYTF